MNPRIASIENLIASDPGGRNVFALMMTDQLRLAAQSLRLGRRVAIVSGFFVPQADAGETDGPPGAMVLGWSLNQLGIAVDYVTDRPNAPLFRAIGLDPIVEPPVAYLDEARPTHLVAVERAGRAADGRYRNMRGTDITEATAPLDGLFLCAALRGLTTIGIGDGGNEIGMGRVFSDALSAVPHGVDIATIVATDFCIAAGTSNWGALGLVGALSVLAGRDLLPSADELHAVFERLVRDGGAVDGVTRRRETTCDGVTLSATVRMLESIRRHTRVSPLESGRSLNVGILGYGETGKAAAALLRRFGHRVRISDEGPVTLDPGLVVDGVEAGGHTIEFLSECDLIVCSPGVVTDAPILTALHQRGIVVISELELAYQLGVRHRLFAPDGLIGVTGTVGKRTTVELLEQVFHHTGRSLLIGGNRGRPLSELLASAERPVSAALAVSSFQLESVVHFSPRAAVILNIDEAHLDRHQSVAEYLRIKSRIFMNHEPDDVLILSFDDPRLRIVARKHAGRTFFCSARQRVDRGAWLAGSAIHVNLEGTVETIRAASYPYPENLVSAVLAARLFGISADKIQTALAKNPARSGSAETLTLRTTDARERDAPQVSRDE